MDNIEQYLSKVDYYIEQAHKTKDQARREALLKASREVLDMLGKITGNDTNAKTAIADRLLKIDSVKKSKNRFDGIKHFMANHKKLAAISTAGIILAGSLVGCTSTMQNAKENVAVVETNDKLTDYDKSLYSRNPLSGETLVSDATGFAEEMAKNGAFEMDEYGPDMFAIVGILNTHGSMKNKDEFVRNIDLEEYFKDTDINKVIRLIDEQVEKVVNAKGNIDWSKIVSHKPSAEILNKTEKLFNAIKDGKPTAEQKKEFNDLLNHEIIDDIEKYNAFSHLMLTHYMNAAYVNNVINADQIGLFFTNLGGNCNEQINCDFNNDKDIVAAMDTIFSSQKQLLVQYLNTLTEDKEKHQHSEKEIYFSYDEIREKFILNVKDLKNAEIDLEEKVRDNSKKAIDAVTSEKYPGKQVDESDPHINHATGNYESGNHRGGTTKGDVVDLPDKDIEGNPTEDLKDDEYYIDLAFQHFNDTDYFEKYHVHKKDENLYKNSPAYRNAWDKAKKTFDEASVAPPADDNVVDIQEDENEIYYSQGSTTSSTNQGNTNESETGKSSANQEDKKEDTDTSFTNGDNNSASSSENIVSVEEDEETVYDDDYVLGDDGYWYPAGQLPEGVKPASLEEETISKTR